MTFARVIKRALKRDTNRQTFVVPEGAKPVAFLNRAGEPTVYFECYAAEDSAKKANVHLVLTTVHGECPPGGSCDFIGVAEFSGGQVVYAAWHYRPAKE